MPGGKPCPVGCTCGQHPWGKLGPEEQRRRKLAQKLAADRADPERRRAGQRVSYARNRDQVLARGKARRDATPGLKSAQHRKYNYGLTPERLAELFVQQNGKCYLCDDVLDLTATFAVDHDHSCCPAKSRSCGACIRGLTCPKCNVAIGQFGDDPQRMRLAADRLEAANARLARERAGRPVQGELQLNVFPLERREATG